MTRAEFRAVYMAAAKAARAVLTGSKLETVRGPWGRADIEPTKTYDVVAYFFDRYDGLICGYEVGGAVDPGRVAREIAKFVAEGATEGCW